MKFKKIVAVICMVPAVSMAQEYGTVKSSTPNYRTYSVPFQTCQQVSQPVRTGPGGINTGTVIGGVAGGIIGNQIGQGDGNVAATAIGAVVGALAGQSIAGKDDVVNQCTTRYEQRRDISDFNVTVEYKGSYIPVRMNYPPNVGDKVPVQIVVQ
jgi:uncharacterized protein YcfJ